MSVTICNPACGRKFFVIRRTPAICLIALWIGCGGSPPVESPTPATAVEEPVSPATALRGPEESAPPKPSAHPVAKEWYTPREVDFRPDYDRDAANQSKQSWDDHWYWIQTFYQGNILSNGWTAQGTAILSGVGSEQTRDELRSDLNELGRRVAGEWGKSKAVRKIDTNALRAFGGRLTKAAKLDDGSGRTLRQELQAVRVEVEARFAER